MNKEFKFKMALLILALALFITGFILIGLVSIKLSIGIFLVLWANNISQKHNK